MTSKFETKKKKSLPTLVREHKKEITIGVLTIGTIVTGIVIYQKCNVPLKKAVVYSDTIHFGTEAVKEHIPNSLLDVEIAKNYAVDNNSASKTINVHEYIRKLPENYKHSHNAVELAEKLGYKLLENETFVKSYSYLKTSA